MLPRHPPTSIASVHSLAILSEYTHTLDSLPLDLSRNFADLRELDAVLSSSMSSLTSKITQLTSMIETNSASKEERLWLLTEIAEEAGRLKPGADDKIRVACHAADGLRSHRAHMTTLLERMPDPEFGHMANLLGRKTVYPHVATRSYMPAGMSGEGGRRQRRGAYGSLLVNSAAPDATPHKRKRGAGKEDEVDVIGKSPRKERTGDGSRQRNGARAKKAERAGSPTESILSVASHLPQANLLQAQSGSNNHNINSRQAASARAGSAASTSKRARGQAHTAPDPPSHNSESNPSRKDLYNAPPASTHPSLPLPYANANGSHSRDSNSGRAPAGNSLGEWTHGQLEGPGMPIARAFVGAAVANVVPDGLVDGAVAGEVDGEGDDGRTYCFCDGVSYGEMIACDDETCEREWFHLSCIGLTVPPDGTWYCETCSAKRNAKRSGRGGKRRSGNGRSNGRNASG